VVADEHERLLHLAASHDELGIAAPGSSASPVVDGPPNE
jgi:hypothetical protein